MFFVATDQMSTVHSTKKCGKGCSTTTSLFVCVRACVRACMCPNLKPCGVNKVCEMFFLYSVIVASLLGSKYDETTYVL